MSANCGILKTPCCHSAVTMRIWRKCKASADCPSNPFRGKYSEYGKKAKCRRHPRVRPENRFTVRPSVAVRSPGIAGFASTQTEVSASAKDATTSEFSAVCTDHCTEGMPESQFLGWRPVWLTANLDTASCQERKTQKVDRQGRVGGSNRVRQNSPSFSPLCGVATPRVLQTLCGKLGREFFQAEVTQKLPARMEKCMEQTAHKYMQQISPPGGHLSTSKMPQKTA